MQEILERGDKKEIRATFLLDYDTSVEEMVFLFRVWSRHFFPRYFMDETETFVIADAPFHDESDRRMVRCYMGLDKYFVDVAFRGAAKTARKKLFRAFVIANDSVHRKKYFKVLTKDPINGKQIVTDIFNMFVDKQIQHYYPEIFSKTEEKRSETMSEFDTATGIKMLAGTVGTEQRGQIQDQVRPDDIWFDDFETRKVLRSAVTINAIWDNMEEARTGLSLKGCATYTCNYLSERGNVHKLIEKYPDAVLRVPIKGTINALKDTFEDGPPTWPAKYTPELVEQIIKDADDAAGEYLCMPSIGEDVYFDRATLDKQEKKTPIREIAGFKIFHEYDPSHRYGSGHDVGGGLGLDHSTSVFIDFTQMPARVVGTFKNNTIRPEVFGDEIVSEAHRFGRPIVAIENNKFDAAIGRAKQIYDNLYFTEDKAIRVGLRTKTRTFGWNTNGMTKGTMLSALKKAVADGHLELSDADLIKEMRSYTRDDFMDKEEDPRETTRHFDLLMACAIAFQMRNHAVVEEEDTYQQPAYQPTSEFEDTGDGFSGDTGFTPHPVG